MKRFVRLRWLAVLIVAAGVGLFWGFESSDDRNFQIAKNLDIFNSIVKELDLFYVDTIQPEKTIREGIDAMLYSLDPYTAYYPEDDQSELEQMVKGTYGGIGSVITWNDKLKRSMIAEPYEGMPAAVSGLKAGDILMEIDGEDLAGKNNAEVSEMLRGQVGTSFRLKVQRPCKKKPLEFNIVRRSIQLPLIPYYAKLDSAVGYINLSSFSGNPSKEFKEAFLDLRRQGIRSLVIDLRNNGGGLLDEAIEIANFFVPRGKTLVTTKGKIKQSSNVYKTLRQPLDLDIPLAVLVNSGTASSSEILAGSLQDLDRAVIVGNRTYGKGLVQTTRPMGYNSYLKITTAKYYLPSGRCIQAIDYSHRAANGAVNRIPDSLTNVFHTAAGRPVRDGGGITPDVTIEPHSYSRLSYSLVAYGVIEEFVLDYVRRHETIAPAEEFRLTDADYEDFIAFARDKEFDYRSTAKTYFDIMCTELEKDGLKDAMAPQIEALEESLDMEKEEFLRLKKDEIVPLIEEEIVVRYYFQPAGVIVRLRYDDALRQALASERIAV